MIHPVLLYTLLSCTQRHIFQDHYMKHIDSTTKDNKYDQQKENIDKSVKIKLWYGNSYQVGNKLLFGHNIMHTGGY